MHRILDGVKVVIFVVSYWTIRITRFRRTRRVSWVVGVEEIAGMVRHISDAIPGSHSVCLTQHPFYDYGYDSVPTIRSRTRLGAVARLIERAVLLADLVSRAEGFIYVGRLGFLGLSEGSRAFEFQFIKRRGLALCCYFTGNDIRSPKLMHELEANTGVPNIATVSAAIAAEFESDSYERLKRRTAREADAWADVVFNAAVDQLSYLTVETEPFLYFLPDDYFLEKTNRAREPIVVLHAPSSSLAKGTAQVREAVARLHDEGYEFEYVELSRVPHSVVQQALARTHIVLNQFYAFMPGVFGIESMAAGCAVLMSADANIETDLPPGSEGAWVVTKIDEIHDHLRRLLDRPEEIRRYAEAGQEWAWRYASATASRARLSVILRSVLNGEYAGRIPWEAPNERP